MQSRSSWVLATMSAVFALVALGVGFSGYKNTPKRPDPSHAIIADPQNPQDKDPLAPRLFDQTAPFRVHVAGAVKKPGVYSLPSWARVVDAVKKAGGPAEDADLDALNLADKIQDGEQVRIPVKGRPEALESHRPTPDPPAVPPTVGGTGTGRYPFSGSPASAQAQDTGKAPLNLNQASAEELSERLSGVGPAIAERIVQYRKEHGPFLRPEDLMNVKGIGEKTFAKLRGQIVTR